MLSEIKQYLNFTQLFVVVTYTYFLIVRNPKNKHQRIVLLILTLDFFAEAINVFLLVSKKGSAIGVVYSLMSLCQNGLWLLLMYKVLKKEYLKLLLTGYLTFGVLNFFFYEGTERFNHYTFIVGALLYIAVFVYESFYLLKNEDLSFFNSNGYFLLFCPIIFMLGYSILISFNNRIINTTIVFAGIPLYHVIGCFTNFIYYSLLIIYSYRTKKS